MMLTNAVRAAEDMTWLMSNFPPVGIPLNGRPSTGMADLIARYLISQWPEASHRYLYANPNRVWSMIAHGEHVCFSSALHTAERERYAYFRDTYLLPPPQLIVRPEALAAVPLNGKGEAEPAALMKTPALRGLLVEHRAYGRAVDGLLKYPASTPNVKRLAASNYGGTILTMMTLARADYTIEYDFALAYAAASEPELGRLKIVPFAGAEDAIVGGFACPRTEWGRAAIEKIDRILKTPEGMQVAFDAEMRWLGKVSALRYEAPLREFLRHPRAPEKPGR